MDLRISVDSKGGSETGLQLWKEIKRSFLLMGRTDSTGVFEPVSSTRHGGKNSSWRRGQAPQEHGWNLKSDKTDIFVMLYAKFSSCY